MLLTSSCPPHCYCSHHCHYHHLFPPSPYHHHYHHHQLHLHYHLHLWYVHYFVQLKSFIVCKLKLRYKPRSVLTTVMSYLVLLRLGNSFLHQTRHHFLDIKVFSQCITRPTTWCCFTLLHIILIPHEIPIFFFYLKTMLSRTQFSFYNYFHPSYLSHTEIHLIPGKMCRHKL